MRQWHNLHWAEAMASPWRRRRVCTLAHGATESSVALRTIDGRGARLDAERPPALGSAVELRHPEAGVIRGTVSEVGLGMIRIVFDGSEHALAFALRAIASDMTCEQ